MTMAFQPDKAIIDAERAGTAADASYAAIVAGSGVVTLPEEEAELGAAQAIIDKAKDILCAYVPTTMAGVRAILRWQAADASLSCDDARSIADNLLASGLI